jgi:hypothetical protein
MGLAGCECESFREEGHIGPVGERAHLQSTGWERQV